MKHLGAVEIHPEINKVLGEGTVGYSIITRYLQLQSLSHSSEVAEEETEIGSRDPIDRAILQVLNEQPVASLRQLAKRILIPMTTIRYHLVNKMGYKIRQCKWMPHKPSATQEQTRVTTSRSLLDLLHLLQHQD
jgi:hypothetical protein